MCDLSEQTSSNVIQATEKQQMSEGFVRSWSYFDKLNERRAKCKICSKLIMGHTNVTYHLKAYHPDEYDIYKSCRRPPKYCRAIPDSDSPSSSLSDEDEKANELRSEVTQTLSTKKASMILSPMSACRPCYVHIGSLKATLMENANALQWLLGSRLESDKDGLRQFQIPISSLLQSERSISTSSGTSVRLCFEPIQRVVKDGASICEAKTKTTTTEKAPTSDHAQPCTSQNSASKPSLTTVAKKRKAAGRAAFSAPCSSVEKRSRPSKLTRQFGIRSNARRDHGIPSCAKTLKFDRLTSEKMRLYDRRFEELFRNSASLRKDSETSDWTSATPDEHPMGKHESKLHSILQNAASSCETARDNGVRAFIWCCKSPLPGFGNQKNIQYLFELAD